MCVFGVSVCSFCVSMRLCSCLSLSFSCSLVRLGQFVLFLYVMSILLNSFCFGCLNSSSCFTLFSSVLCASFSSIKNFFIFTYNSNSLYTTRETTTRKKRKKRKAIGGAWWVSFKKTKTVTSTLFFFSDLPP